MKKINFIINRLNVVIRVLVVFVVVGGLYSGWRFGLIPEEMKKTQELKKALSTSDSQLKQLTGLDKLTDNMVYKDKLTQLKPEEVLQKMLVDVPGVALTKFDILDTEDFPTDNKSYKSGFNLLGVDLKDLKRTEYEVVLSGDYMGVLSYLKALSESELPIYYSTIHYEVDLWPKAIVTLHAFTIEG